MAKEFFAVNSEDAEVFGYTQGYFVSGFIEADHDTREVVVMFLCTRVPGTKHITRMFECVIRAGYKPRTEKPIPNIERMLAKNGYIPTPFYNPFTENEDSVYVKYEKRGYVS